MKSEVIAQAGPLHAHALAVLHAGSFPKAWSAEEFAALLNQPGIAAWMHGPDGFILIRAVADEAEILTLAVVPAARRKRIAASLLQEAVRVLQQGGSKKLFLEVAADNVAALALYQKHGFAATGRRANYYVGNIDAVIMTRLLSS